MSYLKLRRSTGLALMLALLLPILAACGGSSTPSDTSTNAPVATEAPAAEAPATEEATEAPAEEATEAPAEEATEAPAAGTQGGLTKNGDLLVASVESCDVDGYAGIFKEIAAVDANTVQFTLCNVDPAFEAKLAFAAFQIAPSEYIESTGGTGDLIDKPIGTGPWKIESWNRGDSIVLVRNDEYWGEKPSFERLVIRWSTEAAQRLLELQSGTVDGIDNVGTEDIAVVQNDPNLQLLERPALSTFYLGLVNTTGPLQDEKVRQALAMAIDKQRIVDNFYPAGSSVANYFTPCTLDHACSGEPWYAFDVEAARALLAEAGYADGFDIDLSYRDVVRGYLPQPAQVAQDIQAQLKDNLNVNVNINVMESGAFIDAANAGTLEGMFMLGWGADYPEVTNFLDYHFGASSKSFGTSFDDIVEALKQGASLASFEERDPFYVAANNAIRQHVPMIPIAHGGSAVAFAGDVENANTSPLGNERFELMTPGTRDTFVWMQNAEPTGFYCADESDGESFRICQRVSESLLANEVGGTKPVPGLATECTPSDDLLVWTCKLRENVTFHDGSAFDANDVVMSYWNVWDAASPYHVGRTGDFTYFEALWGSFMNAK
jgi:peptide/nickel transport system substrate-binding protein